MQWVEILIEIPAESAEAVTALLLEFGSQGVAEIGGDPRILTGFLPESDDLLARLDDLDDRLARLTDYGLSAPLNLSYRHVEDADWANEWKRHFRPLEIGRRLVIKPSWETYERDPDRLVIELDPGMAFGTGTHPTTALCLEALEDYVTAGSVVADIGCGSGILSLAAARLGAAKVHATDIDPLPRQIARENVARNGLEERITIHAMEAFDAAARDCDLVVANIIASVILELIPSVYARLKPGGLFIACGIVEERLPEVVQALAQAGFTVGETRSREVWRAIVSSRS
jgi:ribosomal protein L11 methyltransferase